MNIIHYQLDINSLLKRQDAAKINNDLKKKTLEEDGQRNKIELLKYVLPFVHGVLALHNHKCNKRERYGSRYGGLLGYGKKDIQEKLDYIAKTTCDVIWKDNYQTFTYSIGNRKIKIWLNKRDGCHVHNRNLPYSLTSFKQGQIYGESIEEELQNIADYCGVVFTDEWE